MSMDYEVEHAREVLRRAGLDPRATGMRRGLEIRRIAWKFQRAIGYPEYVEMSESQIRLVEKLAAAPAGTLSRARCREHSHEFHFWYQSVKRGESWWKVSTACSSMRYAPAHATSKLLLELRMQLRRRGDC